MTGHRIAPGFAALSLIESYWEALRGADLLPDRADVDPRGIDAALDFAFIAERTPEGAQFRVAGAHLVALMGRDARRAPVPMLFRQKDRLRFARIIEEVCTMPATCTLRLRAQGDGTRRILDARMNLLPLRDDNGEVERLLGCFVALGQIGAAPRQFSILDQMIQKIEPGAEAAEMARAITRGEDPTAAGSIGGTGFAAPATPFDRKGAPVARPHLRLVKSDD